MSAKTVILYLAALPLALAISAASPSEASPIAKLRIDSAVAYKYAGYQPIDVLVTLVDDRGLPVDDASVLTAYDASGRDFVLKGIGKGYYMGCDIAYAKYSTVLTVGAKKGGMLPANTIVKTQPGNLCGAGESQLIVSTPVAAKPDGAKQPLDLYVDVSDEAGNPVEGAKVVARATDYQTFVDAPLVDTGKGRYKACAFGFFGGSAAGRVSIHVRAERTGYTPGASDGNSTVGRLCPVP